MSKSTQRIVKYAQLPEKLGCNAPFHYATRRILPLKSAKWQYIRI